MPKSELNTSQWENALDNALTFNRQIISCAGEGVVVYDNEFRYIEWNPFMEKLTGFKKEEVLGKRAFDLFPYLVKSGIDKLISRALKGETVISSDFTFSIPSKGRSGWVRGTYTPLLDKNNKVIGVIGLVRDISSQKLAEERLNQSQELMRFAVEATGFGIYFYDFTSSRNYYSPELLSFYGLAPDATIELDAELVPKAVHPDDKAIFLEGMRKANDPLGSGILDMEYRIIRTDGKVIWLSVRGKTFFSGPRKDYRPIRANGVVRDITERKQSECALLKQSKALEQKNIALREMIEQIALEKNKIKERVSVNVSEVLLPIIKKLNLKGSSQKYVKMLEQNLRELSSPFGMKITSKIARLTPKEIEICSMIKSGLSSKDISGLLNSSILTVSKHRRNIRKKLGLSGKSDNLASFLQNL